MNNKVGLFLAFVAGAAAGSCVAWKMLEKKYKQIADDEIESVKEVFNRKLNKKVEEEKKQAVQEKYGDVVESLGYKKETNKEDEKDMVENAKVYVIPPEVFGELDGYDTVSLTYYADKVLVENMSNKVIKNVNETVGRNSLETFGEYEDDSVFVRNENLKRDFEILLDMRKYSDIVSKKPHLVEDGDDD